jgi:hypothetical protein
MRAGCSRTTREPPPRDLGQDHHPKGAVGTVSDPSVIGGVGARASLRWDPKPRIAGSASQSSAEECPFFALSEYESPPTRGITSIERRSNFTPRSGPCLIPRAPSLQLILRTWREPPPGSFLNQPGTGLLRPASPKRPCPETAGIESAAPADPRASAGRKASAASSNSIP